jgi:hypothetical protein
MRQTLELQRQLVAVGGGGHRRRGRGRSTEIRYQIAERDVHFVPDRGNDRDRDRRECSRHALAVEGPEVFLRSPAPADDRQVELGDAGQQRERRADFAVGALSLDSRRHEDEVGRPAALQHRGDITECRAVGTRDDGDATRQCRQGALAGGIEQPVALEGLLGLVERDLPQAAGFGGEEVADGEAEFAAFFPDRREAEGEDFHAVTGRRRQSLIVARPHHAAQLGHLVAQREVPVSAAVGLEARDFPLDPQRHETGFDHRSGAPGDLGNAPRSFGTRRREQI